MPVKLELEKISVLGITLKFSAHAQIQVVRKDRAVVKTAIETTKTNLLIHNTHVEQI